MLVCGVFVWNASPIVPEKDGVIWLCLVEVATCGTRYVLCVLCVLCVLHMCCMPSRLCCICVACRQGCVAYVLHAVKAVLHMCCMPSRLCCMPSVRVSEANGVSVKGGESVQVKRVSEASGASVKGVGRQCK